MLLNLGESGNFIFAKHEFGFSVEVGIARSTDLWYYQVRSVNVNSTWSDIVLNDDCRTFEEAFERAKVTITNLGFSIEYNTMDVMHMKREQFEKIDWAKELA